VLSVNSAENACENGINKSKNKLKTNFFIKILQLYKLILYYISYSEQKR